MNKEYRIPINSSVEIKEINVTLTKEKSKFNFYNDVEGVLTSYYISFSHYDESEPESPGKHAIPVNMPPNDLQKRVQIKGTNGTHELRIKNANSQELILGYIGIQTK